MVHISLLIRMRSTMGLKIKHQRQSARFLTSYVNRRGFKVSLMHFKRQISIGWQVGIVML